MEKKYLYSLFIVFILIFTDCSTEKDTVSDKPSSDSPNKPPTYIGEDFTLLAKDHIIDSDVYAGGGILQNQNSNVKYNMIKRVWQGMPSICKDRLGNLYVAWITGGKGEGNDNYITVSYSTDNGITWNYDKLILYTNSEEATRVLDPSLFNDKFGNLYIAWSKGVDKSVPDVWYSKLTLIPEKATINFTNPRKIASGIMINKPFSSAITNQMVFPIAIWYTGDHNLEKPFMYKGNYDVSNLTNFAKVGGITMDPSVNHHIYEHMFVELKDSTYLGMTRDLPGIFYSKSKDGKVWDTAKKLTSVGLTTSSRFHLSRLQSGRLILIFNNAKNRANITVSLSDDEGATWPYKKIIDTSDNTPFGVSYPDMIESNPGVINIVYYYVRSPSGTIKFVRINEDDIINNTSEVSIIKISSVQ